MTSQHSPVSSLPRLDANNAELLQRLSDVLDRARQQRQTMTYLQAADAINIQPPHRIHQVTQLLETLLEQDHRLGQPVRTALVISRARAGQPADGFYAKAHELGLFDGTEPARFHERCLQQLFSN